jgi:nitrite transporter NirC
MIQSILAGIMIALAAGIYLTVGGPIGAFLFSFGLLTILHFQFYLFTGKAGLLVQNKISPIALAEIYYGNMVGCGLGSMVLLGSGVSIVEPAAAIIATRVSNSWFENIFLGIICGILMYIAVESYISAPYMTVMCVSIFILFGANHCIADIVYMFLAADTETFVPMTTAIFYTTLGNVIGASIIPYSQ